MFLVFFHAGWEEVLADTSYFIEWEGIIKVWIKGCNFVAFQLQITNDGSNIVWNDKNQGILIILIPASC